MLRSEKNEVYKKKKRNLSDVSWIDVIRKKGRIAFLRSFVGFLFTFPSVFTHVLTSAAHSISAPL